jgi:hypothetical protein
MTEARAGEAAWSHFAGLALVYALGFGVGLLGLLYSSRLWKARPRASIGPGAIAAAETTTRQSAEAALRTGMAIAPPLPPLWAVQVAFRGRLPPCRSTPTGE